MEKAEFGVIGGSGFYKLLLLRDPKKILVNTPFGNVEATIGFIRNKKVAFLPRHGEKHSVPPHKINYRANAYAMYLLGVKKVIATSAVGSLKEVYPPGTLIIPNQIIDFTKNREYTFFDGEFQVEVDGEVRKGVYHVDVTEPYCEELRQVIHQVGVEMGIDLVFGGVYICTEGPRFETPAEVEFFRRIGGDVVGMTNSPEVFLFKELGLCYALISVVTNYAAGMQKKVSQEEVIEIFNKKIDVLVRLIGEIIARL